MSADGTNEHDQMRRDLDAIQESLRKMRSDSTRELQRLADDRAAATDARDAEPDDRERAEGE